MIHLEVNCVKSIVNNINNKTFGFFSRGGIELRTYFTEELSTIHNNSILYYSLIDTEILKDYQKDYPVKLEKIDTKDWKRPSRIDYYFLSIFRARERLKGYERFKLYGNIHNKYRKKDFLIGNEFVYRIANFIRNLYYRRYKNIDMINKLKEDGVTDLVLCGYLTPELLTMIYSAKACNIRIWSIIHSWKDVYINANIPFELDGLFVWSESMKQEYLKRNPHLNKEYIYVVGNPRMERFRVHKPYRSLDYYVSKYGFSHDRYKILYTCVNPKIVNNEEKRILEIYNLLNIKLGKSFEILVKINPMDPDVYRWEQLSNYERIYVLENDWTWNSENNINYPTHDSEIEWIDLLYYSHMTMNIASTVSIESLLMNRPVINIAFDEHWKICEKALTLSNAPFYRKLLDNPDVKLVFEKDALVSAVRDTIHSKHKSKIDDILVKWNRKLFEETISSNDNERSSFE